MHHCNIEDLLSWGSQGKAYEYMESELFETAYGVDGLVKEKKKEYEDRFSRGVARCILAAVPMFITIAMELPEYMISASVPVLLILVAAGVYQIVQVCTIKGSCDILLQEGEYSSKEKHIKKRMEVFRLYIGAQQPPSILAGVSGHRGGTSPGSSGQSQDCCMQQ